MKYRCIKQYDSMDCAAACLASIAWYYGKKIPILEISEALETSKEGTSVWDVCRISEKLGLFASAYKKNIDFKEKELEVPCVAHVYQEDGLAHFIIIYKIKKNSVVIADPAVGIIEVDRKKFFNSEYGEDSPYFWTGVIILFQTTEEFYKKKEGMRIAENKFIELVKKEWKRTIYIILFSAISMAISIVSSFYFGTLIDTVIPNRLIYSLIFMTLMVILMLLIKTIVDWGRAKLSLDISKFFNLELSLKYYKHLLDLQVMSIEKRKNGEFISRFQDVIRVQEALVSGILVLPIDALFIIAVSIILCVLNIKIFAVVVVMCFLYTLVMVGFRKYYSVLNSEEMSREARVTSHLIDSIEGILTVKAYTYNKTIFNNGKKKIERWQDTILNLGSTENLQSAIKVLIGGMGEIIVLCIGALEIIGNNLSIGELVTYNILIGYLLTPVKDIVNLQPLYHSAHVAMERLESVLRIKVEKTKEGIEPFEFDEEIELKDVDFHFVSGKNILNNINIKIRKGDNVAIIGETGSGKTSLAKLFMEFYSPDKGHIYVDGAELQNFEVQEIRKAVVYVSQEDFLFTASVRENLKMGNEEISDEEMIEISRKMGVHQFVSKMERAYDSVLEERGKNLSKGQRQKLSLTRAILRHPKILILDEATSNMDSISEREILNYIKGIRDITLILISHRINVIADSDCIYVLQKGNIVARGTDKQLKEQCKLYRQLYGEEEK